MNDIRIILAVHEDRAARYQAEALESRFAAEASRADERRVRRAIGRSIVRIDARIAADPAPERLLPAGVREALASSLERVHGGMAGNVGPILEMVTEKYLLRGEAEWLGRQAAIALMQEIEREASGGRPLPPPAPAVPTPVWTFASLFSATLLLLAVAAGGLGVRIAAEEHLIVERYPEYVGYAARTKRLIPFVY